MFRLGATSLVYICCVANVRCSLADDTLQRSDLACGPSALVTSAALLDRDIAKAEISAAFDGRLKGEHTLAELQDAAHSLGLSTTILRHDLADIGIPKLPLIVALDESPGHMHFVVLYGQSGRHIQLLDAPRRPQQIELAQLDGVWDGLGMYVALDETSLQRVGLVPRWKFGLMVAGFSVLACCVYLTSVAVRQRGKHA